MPTFQGQLGTPLNIVVDSLLIACQWSLRQVAVGGVVRLVVRTAYVGDTCDVDFGIFDEKGSQLASLRAKVMDNTASVAWTVPETQGGLFFAAEAPSVSIKGRSDTLQVVARAHIGPVEVSNSQNQKVTQVALGETLRWKAKMPSVATGTSCKWSIECLADHHRHVVTTGMGEVVQGEVVVDWKSQYPLHQGSKDHQNLLDKTSETYRDATFVATFGCLGVSGRSEPVAVRTGLEVEVVSQSTGPRTLVKPDKSELSLDFAPGKTIACDQLPVGHSPLGGSDDALGADT